jgi:predicted transcriptional regulator
MYRVQLSFAQTKEYLLFMQQCELLIYDEENNVFRGTLKGKRFLTLHREIIELIFWGRREWTPKLRAN